MIKLELHLLSKIFNRQYKVNSYAQVVNSKRKYKLYFGDDHTIITRSERKWSHGQYTEESVKHF